MPVVLKYFALRGRGEPIRLALAAANVEFSVEGVDYAAMKAGAGTAAYPFGQVPLLVDGDLVLAQMDAILRHIGRKYNLYGSSLESAALIDVVLLAVESLRSAYGDLIYKAELSAEAKETYRATHIDAAGTNTRNGGAHFLYLENLLSRNADGAGFVVGDSLSIADIQLFDIVDLHMREQLFPELFRTTFPLLAAHHDRIAAVPSIAEYLASPRRNEQVNGVAGRG